MTALMPEPVSARGGRWPGSKPPATGSWAGGTASVSSPDQGREARPGEAGRGCLRGSRPAGPLRSAGRGVRRAAPGIWGTRGSDLTTVLCASRLRRPSGRCLQEITSIGGAAQATHRWHSAVQGAGEAEGRSCLLALTPPSGKSLREARAGVLAVVTSGAGDPSSQGLAPFSASPPPLWDCRSCLAGPRPGEGPVLKLVGPCLRRALLPALFAPCPSGRKLPATKCCISCAGQPVRQLLRAGPVTRAGVGREELVSPFHRDF